MLLLFLCLITKIFDHLFGHKNIRTKTISYVPSVLMSHHKDIRPLLWTQEHKNKTYILCSFFSYVSSHCSYVSSQSLRGSKNAPRIHKVSYKSNKALLSTR